MIETNFQTGRTTRLVDWAVERARQGEDVVFLCAFAPQVGHVTDLATTAARARGVLKRRRPRKHSVELVGNGTITVAFGGDRLPNLRRSRPKVAVDDWSEQPWSTRLYLHSWAGEWWTEG